MNINIYNRVESDNCYERDEAKLAQKFREDRLTVPEGDQEKLGAESWPQTLGFWAGK